jgi:CoB--CoM heterodisulfide reductase subunit B
MALAAFWGCFIAGRFPFMEKSTRLVLERLGFDFIDLDGLTCCPEKSVVKNESEINWLVTAARNLAIAEEAGVDLFSPCNGCVGSLAGAARELRLHRDLREEVNRRLAKVGRTYRGTTKIFHLLDLLHDEIGTDYIRKYVELPLGGLGVAVHAGCHQSRPSDDVNSDDPLNPRKFDALIEAIGAESVDYETKLMCCGGTQNTAGLVEEGARLTRDKLVELRTLGVDCLCVSCPACFMQYDIQQFSFRRDGEQFNIPVAYLMELMALSMGIPVEDLALDMHRVPIEEPARQWVERARRVVGALEGVDMVALRKCLECRACEDVCAAHRTDEAYSPFQLMEAIVEGRIEEALQHPHVWHCLECYECRERCFQRFGMVEAMKALKHLAIERGLAPKAILSGLDSFRKTGRLTKPSKAQRQKLGLPDVPEAGVDELQAVLDTRIK